MKRSSGIRNNKMMNSRSHIPEEIIENILVKLPVKSIIRFQIVSKSWFDLIKTSSFIHKHHVQSKENFLAMCFAVGGRAPWESRFSAISIYDDDDAADQETSATNSFYKGLINLCDVNLEVPSSRNNFFLDSDGHPDPGCWHVVGYCNGIMCLSNHVNILLVNPLSKEVVKTISSNRIPSSEDDSLFVGFGFDNMTMDFKVVRIFDRDNCDKNVTVQIAEVYDLRSNSWKELNVFPLKYTILPGLHLVKRSIFFNGAIHWCAITEDSGWEILTYNLANNLFQLMEFPQEVKESRNNRCFCLFVLNQESLAFLSYSQPFSSRDFVIVNVWIMNKHSNEKSWTKLYSIGPLTQFRKPMCFWKKQKFLYLTKTGKLISYDLLDRSCSVVCSVVCDNISNLVCDDVSHIWSFEDDALDSTEVCLEWEVCRSSLFSIKC